MARILKAMREDLVKQQVMLRPGMLKVKYKWRALYTDSESWFEEASNGTERVVHL